MVSDSTIAKVWSQYEEVKDHVAQLHIGFISAVYAAKTAEMLGRNQREYRVKAFQHLGHLKHFGILSGTIMLGDQDTDARLDEIQHYLYHWESVTLKDLFKVVGWLENWFRESHFYDVRIMEEDRSIVNIKETLRRAGL